MIESKTKHSNNVLLLTPKAGSTETKIKKTMMFIIKQMGIGSAAELFR